MNEENDLLQQKINEARKNLSKETIDAIDAIGWKLGIIGLNKKYSVEQLDSLELETELLLCGLIDTEEYIKKIEEGMKISKTEVDIVVNQMDQLVFKKIQKRLIENIEENENKLKEFNEKLGKSDLLSIALSSASKKKQELIEEKNKKETLIKEDKEHETIFKSAGIELMAEGTNKKERIAPNQFQEVKKQEVVSEKVQTVETKQNEAPSPKVSKEVLVDITKGPKEISAPEPFPEIKKGDKDTEQPFTI